MTTATRYKVKKVLEADYKPADGEPFAVCWGREGWMIWCRSPIQTRVRAKKKSVKRKQGGKNGNT